MFLYGLHKCHVFNIIFKCIPRKLHIQICCPKSIIQKNKTSTQPKETTNSEAVHPWLLEDINLKSHQPDQRECDLSSIRNKEATSRTKQRLLGGMSVTNFGRIHHHITHPRQLRTLETYSLHCSPKIFLISQTIVRMTHIMIKRNI